MSFSILFSDFHWQSTLLSNSFATAQANQWNLFRSPRTNPTRALSRRSWRANRCHFPTSSRACSGSGRLDTVSRYSSMVYSVSTRSEAPRACADTAYIKHDTSQSPWRVRLIVTPPPPPPPPAAGGRAVCRRYWKHQSSPAVGKQPVPVAVSVTRVRSVAHHRSRTSVTVSQPRCSVAFHARRARGSTQTKYQQRGKSYTARVRLQNALIEYMIISNQRFND